MHTPTSAPHASSGPSAVPFDCVRLAANEGHYASAPIAAAVTWVDCFAPGVAGEWYLVVFRSVRHPAADEIELSALDEAAHREAMSAPGFIHYFKGPLMSDRACLSFCLWTDQEAARAASRGPAHRAAMALTASSYERYDLELYAVRSNGKALSFAPIDVISH